MKIRCGCHKPSHARSLASHQQLREIWNILPDSPEGTSSDDTLTLDFKYISVA